MKNILVGKPFAVGLRDATPEEIIEILQELRSHGHKVRHKTHTESGVKLPHNGIIITCFGDKK